MVNHKRIVKNSIFLYLRMMVVLICDLYIVRVVLQALGAEDYGLFNVVGGVVASLSFLTGVLSTASMRFFSVELGKKEKGNLSQVFFNVFIVFVSITIVALILGESLGLWFVSEKITCPEAKRQSILWVYHISLISFVITLSSTPYRALFLAYENMNFYAIISIVEVFLKLIVAFMIFLSPIDRVIFYAIGLCIVAILISIAYFMVAYKKYPESRLKYKPSKQILKDVFSYSSWSMFGSIANICYHHGLNIFLNILWGPLINAVYTIGNQVGNALNLFGISFFSAVRPALIKEYVGHDVQSTLHLFNLSNKVLFFLVGFLILIIYPNTEIILNFWLKKYDYNTIIFVKLFLFNSLILTMHLPITAIIQAAGKVKIYHGIVDGFTILCMPFIYYAIQFIGKPEFVVISSIIVFGCAHIIRLLIMKRIVCFSILSYLFRFFVPALISLALPLYLANFFISSNHSLLAVFIKTGCLLSVFLMVFFIVVLEKNDRCQILKFLKRKF